MRISAAWGPPTAPKERIRSWSRNTPHGDAIAFATTVLKETVPRGLNVPEWFTYRLGVNPSLLRKKHRNLSEYGRIEATYARCLYHLYKTAPGHLVPSWLVLTMSTTNRGSEARLPLPHWRRAREVIRTSCRILRSLLSPVTDSSHLPALHTWADPLRGFTATTT